MVGATLNEYLNKEIKYHAKVVPDAFRQYHALVEQTKSLYDQYSTKLNADKKSLFNKGFSQKWQVSSEFNQELVNDFSYCNEHMLPEQTKKVRNLADETEYFTEQMFREVKRIVEDNIQM